MKEVSRNYRIASKTIKLYDSPDEKAGAWRVVSGEENAGRYVLDLLI